MKKRSCIRFHVPGTTLSYKKKPGLLGRGKYSEDSYPVVDLSRGGAKFLCQHRLKIGREIVVKIDIPEAGQTLEAMAVVRWAGKNPEPSYRFQTGIAFKPYGKKKGENPPEILEELKKIEAEYSSPETNNNVA
ncbi:MAG: PilZ domain-containing protein [Desulfobacteraceae bacterium]|nr:PilZ domain-containing protein [Desulfobacteraceae bacterium]